MNDPDLDRIVSRQQQKEEIIPSSGFVSSVMDAVHQQAAAPPPIPFPWKRALPGLIASLALAVGMVVHFVRLGVTNTAPFVQEASAPPSSPQLQDTLTHILDASIHLGLGWILFALLLSLITAKLSMRLAAGKS